ncbi:MAG: glycosyl transferase family 2 [Gammaproteobacteria bacterium HGW-Gammaproteobacteria-3]|nr:MAG: glycosyl transferase family 2 [Gammaproteobacteria bacterium HGW-Gammaproteobacteria-3]
MSQAPDTPPKVTVFIPVYNRERYIAQAIESILGQTFTDFELLLVDDGSTDRSRDIVQGFHDPRVRLVCNEVNLGIPGARNKGIDLAKGEYLAFLDSDDVACPTRLARQVEFLDQHPDYAAVSAWISWVNAKGKPIGKVKRKALSTDEIAAQRLFRCCLENTASMARTAILQQYRHREQFILGSDYDLWARIGADYKLAALPEVLVRRREHEGRTTEGKTEQIKALRLLIYADQLTALGVAFTDNDLDRHYLLRRIQKMGAPDQAYLDWAETWLLTLQKANRRLQRYPEPAFSEVLGGFWFKVCWHAFKKLGWQVWPRFWRSALRGVACAELKKLTYLYLPGTFRREGVL